MIMFNRGLVPESKIRDCTRICWTVVSYSISGRCVLMFTASYQLFSKSFAKNSPLQLTKHILTQTHTHTHIMRTGFLHVIMHHHYNARHYALCKCIMKCRGDSLTHTCMQPHHCLPKKDTQSDVCVPQSGG